MDLNNFDNKTQLLINAAFNNACESELVFFTPISLLVTILQNDQETISFLKENKLDENQILNKSMELVSKEKTGVE